MDDVLAKAEEWRAEGEEVALATVVATRRSAPRPLGSKLAVTRSGRLYGSVSGGCVEADVAERCVAILDGELPRVVSYGIEDEEAWTVGLPCGGEIEVFVAPADADEVERVRAAITGGERLAVTTTLTGDGAGQKAYGTGEGHSRAVRTDEDTFTEHYAPPPVLMIFGAVDTAQEMCRMAKQLGFRTIVSDARGKFATRERLPDADEVVVGWPAMAYDKHAPDDATYVVVLTHDARFDEPALGPALRSPAPYIGALGSRRAQDARRRRLLNAGYTEADIERISGPMGLDIGATTPAETALSVLAEVLAAKSGRSGGRLAEAAGRIHVEPVAG